MRRWIALVGVILAAQLCFPAFLGQYPWINNGLKSGKAFVTQSSTVMTGPAEETYFGDNWGSVRIFPLTQSLNRPLKVYIDTKGLYQPQYRDYAVWSMNSWAQALEGRLTYVLINSPRNADITLSWVPSFDDKYVAGLTTYEVGHADIQIKTIGVPEKDIKANIIHEFGHALGIAGHSNNSSDIMVGMRRWHRGDTPYEPRLSRSDVQALRRLYSATWARGEDLYGALAQRAAIPTASRESVAVNPLNGTTVNSAANNIINLEPLEDQISGQN